MWIGAVSRRMVPWAKTFPVGVCSRQRMLVAPVMNDAMRLAGLVIASAMGAFTTISPPSCPEPGPISSSQSVSRSSATSWSTTSTELPSANRSRMTPRSPSTLAG